jgi:hypothetical protein
MISAGQGVANASVVSKTTVIFKVIVVAMQINLHPCLHLSATVGIILVHCPDIVKSFILPIGQVSEELQEACNNDCRFTEERTRKNIYNCH